MYIDNGDPGDSGELHIDVDGHEYTEQENFSYAQDEIVDSYELTEANGDHIVYTDSHHTGTADLVTEYDAQGGQLRQAHFDAHSDHWFADHPTGPPTPDESGQASTGDGSGNGETIMVDTPTGEHSIGRATVDTNHDGKPDTAVVTDANGDTIMYTDTNGDGNADVATEITSAGEVIIAEHTGAHTWAEVETGHLDANGQFQKDASAAGPFDPRLGESQPDAPDAASDQYWGPGAAVGGAVGASAQASDPASDGTIDTASAFSGHGVVRIDAATGQWISPN